MAGNIPDAKPDFLKMEIKEILDFDRQHIWHPYASAADPLPVYPVEKAEGAYIHLSTGEKLLDGMSSWWCAIHGYNHPRLNKAIENQLKKMSHVMFGSLTHEPAVQLAQKLIRLAPEGLEKVFYCDSGSVAVEVAVKMALQYHHAKGDPEKNKLLTFRKGYHGDTWHCMSVCDPEIGMHSLFTGRLPIQYFVKSPGIRFGEPWDDSDTHELRTIIEKEHRHIAAVIVEPIVQGTGGMRFYHPEYLRTIRELCDRYDMLFIADEIATGFGRSGKLFACEWAGVAPDIMCVGKAITGGMMSFAATLATDRVAGTISGGSPGMLMHGPTFMGNPLACAVASENLSMIMEHSPLDRIAEIEALLKELLEEARTFDNVADVRAMGAIGVIEMKKEVDMARIQARFVEKGIWLRPFGKLVYTMPPFIISDQQLIELITKTKEIVREEK